MKIAYACDKHVAIKFLNILEKYQIFFQEERSTLIVKAIVNGKSNHT
jgi:hypothetical protein